MANMGYCRFHNTLQDLRDCEEYLWDDDVSDSEKEARRRLIKLCKEIAANFEEEEDE